MDYTSNESHDGKFLIRLKITIYRTKLLERSDLTIFIYVLDEQE